MVDVSLVHGGGCGDGVSDSGGGYDLKHLVNDLFPTALLTNMYLSSHEILDLQDFHFHCQARAN